MPVYLFMEYAIIFLRILLQEVIQMPRGRRRIVELTSEEIKAKIASNTNEIEELTTKIKALKLENKSLQKDLPIAEVKEKAEAEKKELEDIVILFKNSGKSLEEIKAMLEV